MDECSTLFDSLGLKPAQLSMILAAGVRAAIETGANMCIACFAATKPPSPPN